ncbi:MarR family winged helix-turn-helix transcriptional regulator [Actinopolymorpha alba]|uniref:MarR family winged helix-turn-helix transcriptional regulator n=1 Tax=Actinopolymorpha alba TaxID=533267 RepID=UPI000368E5AE|nr:MarR family transcriptional regulator [Actinopolymorpha alba]
MDEVRWLDATEQEAWRAYLDTTRLLIQTLGRQLETDAGISFTDYELLVHLSEAPERRMRMRDLADATLATRSGVTRAVTRLERAGWVRRVECEDDRRGMHAELTDAGMAKLEKAAPGHVAAVREQMFDLLSSREVEQLHALCARMRKHLEAGR